MAFVVLDGVVNLNISYNPPNSKKNRDLLTSILVVVAVLLRPPLVLLLVPASPGEHVLRRRQSGRVSHERGEQREWLYGGQPVGHGQRGETSRAHWKSKDLLWEDTLAGVGRPRRSH